MYNRRKYNHHSDHHYYSDPSEFLTPLVVVISILQNFWQYRTILVKEIHGDMKVITYINDQYFIYVEGRGSKSNVHLSQNLASSMAK